MATGPQLLRHSPYTPCRMDRNVEVAKDHERLGSHLPGCNHSSIATVLPIFVLPIHINDERGAGALKGSNFC